MALSRPYRLGIVLASGFAVTSLFLSSLAVGQPADPRGQPGERGPGGTGGQSLGVEGSMKLMNRSLRTLKKQIDQPASKDDNLKLINEMERGCVSAKGQPVPGDVLKKAKDDAAKAKLVDLYHRDLVKALRVLLDTEEAIADGKLDVAKAKCDELIALRNESHKAMGIKED